MVKISKKFLKSTLMYTLAGSLPMASAIILLPFYLLYLSTENYGALSIYLALSVLIQILTTYSFDTGIYIFFHDLKRDADQLNKYISSVFIFLGMLGVGLVILLGTFGNFLFDLVLGEKDLTFLPFGLMAVITGVFQSFFKVHSNLLQTSERPGLFFWSNLLSFSLIAGFTILGLEFFPQTLWGPIGGRLIAAVVSGVWVLVRIAYIHGISFHYDILSKSFGFNHSSFIYQLQQWSMNYLDRFIMIFFLPLSTIGVYDFAIKCMLALEFVISGVYNAFYPKVISMVLAQEKKESTQEINRYYHGLVAVIMVLVCMAILFFSLVIDLGLIRSGYEASIKFLPLIGVIYLIRSIRFFFAFPYGALKYSKPLPLIYMFVSVFKVGVILIFIQYFEVYAVIGAALLSTFLEIVLLWYFIKTKFIFHFNKFKIIAAPIILGLTIGVFQSLSVASSYLTYILYIIICFLVLGFLYKKEIKAIRPRNFF